MDSKNYLETLKKIYNFITIQRNMLYINNIYVDYVYSEKSYKIILDFLKKVTFEKNPIIPNTKKVKVRNIKETRKKFAENSTRHEVNINTEQVGTFNSDIIYLMCIISKEIEEKLIRGGLDKIPEYIPINISSKNYEINCRVKLEDIFEYVDLINKNIFGMHPIKLANEYRDFCYEERWQDFIFAVKTLSEYSLYEQYIIRKDNNHLIKKEENDALSRECDPFGNPSPKKSKDIIKYSYKEDEFKNIILDFFYKIRFNESPIIGIGKRVVMVFDPGHAYTKDKVHPMNFRFYNGEPYYPDIIYILDKIKDLIMHTSDGFTNFSFGDSHENFKTLYLKQQKNDFSLDCEIDIKDIKEFCEKLKEYYYGQVHQFPSSATKGMTTEEIIELNNTFGISEQDTIMDLFTYAYTSLLGYDMRSYFVLFDYDAIKDIEWKYFHIEYIKIVEKILGIKYETEVKRGVQVSKFNINDGICGLLSWEDSKQDRKSKYGKMLRIDENGAYIGILWDIAKHNSLIVEALRNSRAHMYINDRIEDNRIQFKNSRRNTSYNIKGEADVPNFTMSGTITNFYTLFHNICDEKYEIDSLIETMNNSDMTQFEKILPCIEQIEILLEKFSEFQKLTKLDIPDEKLLERYKKAGEVAQNLINSNAIEFIIKNIYSFDALTM